MSGTTEAADARQELWIRRYHPAPEGGDVSLVCFPHAGGAASYYHPFASRLSGVAEVLALQYPGRQDRRGEAPITSLTGLADEIHEVLRSRGGRRLVLFGHSMGAVLAFEVARRFEREADERLLGLVVSGRYPPFTPREGSVHKRDDAGVIDEVRRLSGTDSRLLFDEEIVRMILPAIRADYTALETYRYAPGEPLACPVSVLVGESDTQVTVEEARGWREVTSSGDFRFRSFPGGHFYLNDRQDEVAGAVKEDIARFTAARA